MEGIDRLPGENSVEPPIRVRERSEIADGELDLRMRGAGLGDHARREIDAGQQTHRTEPPEMGEQPAGAAAGVQHARPGLERRPTKCSIIARSGAASYAVSGSIRA